MNDKLKEIRDKYCREGSLVMLNTEVIGEIQSETYQLGRQEVIDEITRHVTNRTFARKGELLIFPSDIYHKLNNLKK